MFMIPFILVGALIIYGWHQSHSEKPFLRQAISVVRAAFLVIAMIAVFALGACMSPSGISDGSTPNSRRTTRTGRMLHAWMISMTAATCDAPTVLGYESYSAPFGQARYVWRARCPDGRNLRCSGVTGDASRPMVPAVGALDAMRVDVESGCEVIEAKVARPLQSEQIFDTDEGALGLVRTTAGLCLGKAKLPGDRVVLQIEVEPSGAFSLVREKSTIPQELRPCIDKALGSAAVRPSGFRRELTATLVLEPTEPPESSDTPGDPDEPIAPDGSSNPALSPRIAH